MMFLENNFADGYENRPQDQDIQNLTNTLNFLLDEDVPVSEVQVFVNQMPENSASKLKHSEGGGAFGR